jgi:SAM-dependent methyltransferase
MTYVLYALAALLVFDALRMRGRIGALGKLGEGAGDDVRVIAAPGVTIDPATARAAASYLAQHQVDVVDLVPPDLSAIRAMSLVQLADPAKYRSDRLGPGRTVGHAIAVTADIAARAQIREPADDVAFVELATRLKHYGKADLVIAPAERARPQSLAHRLEILRVLLGPATSVALGALPILWGFLALGIYLRPVPGLIAFGAWQLQPAFALAFTQIRSRDWPLVALFRLPVEIFVLVRTLTGKHADPGAAHRDEYQRLLANGLDPFYEPRRATCPLCESNELAVYQRNGDLLQHKPGTFTLERCRACGHVFQNPRLSLAGLSFYYKDFYDGLGEAGMEQIFGYGAAPYHARARMVRELAKPSRWLDVGAGHGHFCLVARGELPDTHFDGLDFGESIDEARRRGWIEEAYRGQFPEVAPQIAGRYDTISMSHYLEHTRDPRAEIAAAHTALAPAGHLLIEVPDPEYPLGRMLRRWWLPWFQPQHQHLLSVKNLDKLLRERGFEPVQWHRGQAHQKVDFFFAIYLMLDRIAPPTRLPWRRRGALAATWRVLAWTAGSPLIGLAIIVDNLIGPLIARGKVSNTYRVLARRT